MALKISSIPINLIEKAVLQSSFNCEISVSGSPIVVDSCSEEDEAELGSSTSAFSPPPPRKLRKYAKKNPTFWVL